MRGLLLLLSPALGMPALAQDMSPETQTIIVTGTPIKETEARLAACLARKCPPKEDINASIAHAENQLVAGDYTGSRRTLSQARSRNRGFATSAPIEVADLDRAYGRVTDLNGRPDDSRLAQIESLEALRAGLESGDTRIFMQQLLVGDEFARAKRFRAATDVYRRVARQALKADALSVVGFAMYREATLYGALAGASTGYRDEARRQILKIERTQEAELAPFRDAAKLLRARLAGASGDEEELARALAAIPPSASPKPTLVYAPPIIIEDVLTGRAAIGNMNDPEWIDLRFKIAADGTVRDIEILRDSGNVDGFWPDLVHRSVEKRRYAPVLLASGSDGAVRIERFTYVHDLRWATGSRIPGREVRGRITSLDLTVDPSQT